MGAVGRARADDGRHRPRAGADVGAGRAAPLPARDGAGGRARDRPGVAGGRPGRRRLAPPRHHGTLMVVDAHAHVIVPGLGAEVSWRDGAQAVAFGGREIRSAVREFVDLGRILEEQDRARVDVVVLCPWVNLLGPETARQNEALAAMTGARVAALGTIDLERPDELRELVRD